MENFMINTPKNCEIVKEYPKLIPLIHCGNHLDRPSLNIVEGSFVFQGYQPIREKDFDEFYQRFPDQESFICEAKHAILSGHLPILKKVNGLEVIETYIFLKWTIENIASDRWATFLDYEWMVRKAQKDFYKKKTKNKHSFRPKSEIKNKYLVIDSARFIRQQDMNIPIYIMIEHIQNKYEHITQLAETFKKWIIEAGISQGITKNLPQSEKAFYRKKKYIF
jgi:hypothetical protein